MLNYLIMELSVKEIVELTLAVLAIVFSVIQFFDSKTQHRQLLEVANSMSTRFIGGFPKNMGEIVDVLKDARSELDIVTDVAAYGHYSDPENFERYREAIRIRCREGVQVRMLFYSSDAFVQWRVRQFPKEDFSGEVRSQRFHLFFDKFHPGLPKPDTWEAFHKIIEGERRRHIETFRQAGVKLKVASFEILASLWLEDGQEAVFSFQDAPVNQFSFRTRDGSLIEPLQKMFEDMWSRAADYSGESIASTAS